MGLFSSIKKAFKKVVKKVVGSVLGKGSQKAPKIEVAAPEVQYAPEVENPEAETPEVEIGAQETTEQRKRKGKRGLRIDRDSYSGTNIV